MENKVSVGGELTKSINFAMQQNYVPIIRNLVVHNEAEQSLSDLELRITFNPEFAKEYIYPIDEIQPGQSVEISPVRIQLKTEFLFSLTEKMLGSIMMEVFQGEETLYSYDGEIELLAFDQWSGLLFMPEIITAFVTPNHPLIAEIIHDASDILKKWDGNPAFTGYQTRNPQNVQLQAAAIFYALKQRAIVYNNPPANYEIIGQRVRLPHMVLEQKQGTCLDLAVLYAACLEAAGLFPLLFFIHGHAFGGCWLEETTFADCMVDDVSAIEKRTAIGAEELLLVECTDFVAGKNENFERALKHGRNYLLYLDEFECVVDVQRSRGSGIRPIPLRLEHSSFSNDGPEAADQAEGNDYRKPTELDTSMLGKVADAKTPITKQKVWERKLLDLSLRNTLLNFRATKSTFQLMTANLGELEDRLSDGKDFRIMEIPSEWTISLRDTKMFEIENERDLIESIAAEEFKSYRIRTFLTAEELDKNLKTLYRRAKMSMEENGTNTLFLALGFLRWFESDLSEKARYAPLILIPVDIVRNVRNKGYVIRSRQEEPQINVTLLEYLKQDHEVSITGLDPLPQDEHGIDLPLVFNTIRRAILGKSRWNIEEMAFVGLFSFGQFVMWNDIRNRSKELEQNKVVSSLIHGFLTWEPEEQNITADNLDAKILLKDMAIPVSADSSQMVAIASAAAGKSFVLHGPPGTGKSQSITNMIANALYQGQTVLFVAEKIAALNVVQKRLADIGLDPFCLELHSNKTNKTAVLAELNKALEVGRIKSPQEYEETSAKVHEIRNRLNDIIEALHSKREYGVSLYEAIEIFEQNQEQKGKIAFHREDLYHVSKETIAKWDELIRQYIVEIQELGAYARHPFLGYEGLTYSIELREQFAADLNALISSYNEVGQHLKGLFQCVGYKENRSKPAILMMLQISEAALMPALTLTSLIRSQNYESLETQIKQLIQLGKEYNQIYDKIKEQFEESILEYPAEAATKKWKQAEVSWFLPKLLNQNKLLKELKSYAKEPETVNKENILSILEQLNHLLVKRTEILKTPKEMTDQFAGLFSDVATDWAAMEAALRKADKIRTICGNMKAEAMTRFLDSFERVDKNPALETYRNFVSTYIDELQEFKEKYGICVDAQEKSGDWFGSITQQLLQYRNHIGELKNKVTFNQIDEKLRESGLSGVSAAYKEGRVCSSDLAAAYECGLYYELILLTTAQDDRLSDFHGSQYNDLVAKYKEVIDKYQQLTIQELAARLSAKIPSAGTISAATSEMGILKKAIKSNGRMMSLRGLFNQIPTLLRKLCPCMLMSPISVAQYIDPSFPKFDLVIFDEASQIPTSEAVGTIARGENVVVVGDPKQLPPTNFFSSNRIDEENSDKEDLESLLDDCLAISMPQESLKWHYRSRHESLIAFSNMRYYDNKLYTFPSPSDLVSQVKLVHVDGFYDKGKTKQNKAEAAAIVNEIIRRLKDGKLRTDSIGVVTFSSIQQNLIDDMLFEAFKKYPQLEEFDRTSKEPIFIKNLENVQGDERDVILFSVGYGPDKDGKVSMNFGPINRVGGWRRLNVAISRARKAMIVYSVLKPDQIDLSRTRSEGVAGLKGFLEFADRGKNVLAQRAGSRNKEDYIVKEVGAAIKQMGYDVKCNIGSSEFKVDIGVVNPEASDTYLLGILLDGENCREASTARDRFVLQPGVLSGLGWSLLRVWTLDWLDNAERVKHEIKSAIDAASTKKEEFVAAAKPAYAKVEFEKAEPIQAINPSAKEYCSVITPAQGLTEDYYLPQTLEKISGAARTILDEEAPISKKLLMRKVLALWGISRGGSRVERIFSDAMTRVDKTISDDEGRIFYWKKDQNPEEYSIYRVEDQEGNKRSMDDIASQEILNAIVEVLNEQIGLSEVDLIRETARKFGFSRLGNVIETSVKYAVSVGIDKKILRQLDGGNLVLNE